MHPPKYALRPGTHAKLAAVLLAAGLVGCATPVAQHADTVYVNGKIVTADKAFSIAQGVAVKDGRFVAVGSSEAVRRHAGPQTRVVDLAGRTVIPGLMDAHTHMDGAGTAETTAQVIRAKTVAEAQAIIADFIRTKNVPPGQWVQTSRWHPPSQLREQRYLTRQEIDAVAPNHPVYVQTVGHFVMANSRALQLAGIDRNTRDPVGGRIHRDAAGEPTGVLESAAIELIATKVPPATFEQRVAQNIAAQRIYNRSGITSTIVGALDEAQIDVYFAVAQRGESSVRSGVLWRLPAMPPEQFEARLKAAKYQDNTGNDWVRIAGIKTVSDGGMTLKSAYIRDAYADNPSNHGTLAVDPSAYRQNVLLANRYGWRVGTHAVGDRAIDLVLDAFEAADREKSIRGRGFNLIHGSLIAPDQIVRAKKLDIRVDAQNIFMWDKAATVERYMGPRLAQRAIPTRSLLESLGIERTAAGTDNEVNLLNPFVGLYVMVTRKDPRGVVYGADQKLTREQALRLYTNAGPYFTFEQDRKGSIEAGKFADLVVLSADYLTVPEEQIKDIVPLQTVVNGKVVYEAPAR
jgi:predicted amidohydrolase YtcJ